MEYLNKIGFKTFLQEYGVYARNTKGKTLIVGVYVDDLIVTGDCNNKITRFKEQINRKSEMNDLGKLSKLVNSILTRPELRW